MMWMRNADQLIGPLAKRLAKQVRDAVFRHDVVHVGASCGDAGALNGDEKSNTDIT